MQRRFQSLNRPINPLSIPELIKANPALFKSFYSSPVAKALIFFKTGKYAEVNNQFLKLFECTREKVIGKSPDELGLWANLKEREIILKEFSKNKKRSFNFDVRSLKGKIKNVIASFEKIQISGVNFLLEYLLDNTVKRDFETRLKQNEEQYKLLFFSNPLPMCLFDFKTQKFIGINEAFIKHYSYSKNELLKMKISDIFSREELPKYYKFRKTIISKKEQYKAGNSGIWKHKKKNGELIDVEVTRSHVKYDGKNAILILINDITSVLKAHDNLRQKNLEINLLFQSAKEISSTINPLEIYNKIHKVVSKLIPCDGLIISSYDRTKKIITCKAAWVRSKKLDVSKLPELPLDTTGTGLQSNAIISRKSILVNNFDKYARENKSVVYVYSDNSLRKKLKKTDKVKKSALIIPMIHNKKVSGVIQVLSYANNIYNKEHLKLMEAFGAEISTSTANATLYELGQNEIKVRKETENKLLRTSKEISNIYELSKDLSGTHKTKVLFRKVFRFINRAFPSCDIGISIFDRTDNTIRLEGLLKSGVEIKTDKYPPIKYDKTGKGIQSSVIKSKKTKVIYDYADYITKTGAKFYIQDDGSVSYEKNDTFDIADSALIVPLLYEGKTIGTIQLLNFSKRAFTDDIIKMIEALASHIAVSYMNTKLFQQAQNEIEEKQKAREELALRNKEITQLYRAGRELLSTLDLNEIYEIFYRKTINVIPCDSMIISEYHKKNDKIYCKAAWIENTRHDPSDFPPLNLGPDYKGTQSEAIITGNPVIINNFYDIIKDRKDKFLIDDNGNIFGSRDSTDLLNDDSIVTRSALFIPMKLGKNVIGVISVFSFKENAYSEYDLKILESISVNLSVAAANAELYNRAQKEISERIKKEEELKYIKKNLEEAQRIANVGSWVYDLRVNKIFNSSELYRILGLEDGKESFHFDEAMNYIHPDDKMRSMEKIRKAVNLKTKYENEDRIVRPSGEIRFVKITGEPMYDEKDVYIGIQGTLQDITNVKRINEELVRSLGEKEIMIKEIHHRVKNNLQIVSSLLRLQADKIKDETVVEYFKQSEQRIKSMALIHQQLYRTKDLSRINFREYLNELCSYLLFANDTTPGRINLKMDVEDLYFGIDTALPCGLIINELFTNAIKYAFPEREKGTIFLNLHKDAENVYHIMIKDDGIGASTLNLKNSTSLGMELVNTLTDQLEGQISITINNGTEINLSFKQAV